ncbi:MAG: histone deacetylase, partial [candidate division NC10 bacterium]|nr:histone deacetylase [candidate division NC10 bacterium]
GYCCFNDVVIALRQARRTGRLRRVAILDTDAHHGDGTRDLVAADPDVLHVCVCDSDSESADGTKLDVGAPDPGSLDVSPDQAYLALVRQTFPARADRFRPDLIVWYFGFDTHQGDYGDLGLTLAAYLGIADVMLETAGRVCGEKLLVVLGGGSRTDLATRLVPPIIAKLARLADRPLTGIG